MYCTNPLQILPKVNGGREYGAPVAVQCRKCPSCIASRKNDIAGKLMAECQMATDAYFVTLTYKHEPAEFLYRDVQLMLKQLRKFFSGKRKATIRFFCVGERGNLKGRIHWHLILFFDRKVKLRSAVRGKLHTMWEFGWSQIARIEEADRQRRIRYCAKYAAKSVGDQDKACRPRASIALGEERVLEHARATARAGLPYNGTYAIDGMAYDIGERSGQKQRFYVQGITAWKAADAYAEEWEKVRPGTLFPESNFMGKKMNGSDPRLKTLFPNLYLKSYFFSDEETKMRLKAEDEAMEWDEHNGEASEGTWWGGNIPIERWTEERRQHEFAKRHAEVERLQELYEEQIADLDAFYTGPENAQRLEAACDFLETSFAIAAAKVMDLRQPFVSTEEREAAERLEAARDLAERELFARIGTIGKWSAIGNAVAVITARAQAEHDRQKAERKAALEKDARERAEYRRYQFETINGRVPRAFEGKKR